MTMTRRVNIAVTAAIAVALATADATAATLVVPAGGDQLRQALAEAAAGDMLRLGAGVHAGPVVVAKPLTLEGEPGAVVDGGGVGQVIRVTAPDAVIRGLTVRNSGADIATMDAGIFLDRGAARVRIEGNSLEHNLFGVYVRQPHRRPH